MQKKSTPFARQRAFTLIEILITVAIASVLSVGAVLSFAGFLSRHNLDSTASEITAVLRNAQEKSMSQESDSRWGVYFDNTAVRAAYSLFQADEALIGSSTFSAIPGTVLDHVALSSNLTFAIPANGTSTTILFNKITGLPNASTTIAIQLVSDPTSQKQVQISGNGKVNEE